MDSGILTTLLNTFEESFDLRLLEDLPRHSSASSESWPLSWWLQPSSTRLMELLKKIMRIGSLIFFESQLPLPGNSILDGFVATGLKAGGSSAVSLTKSPSA
jgi:hypothetical protein